MAETQAVSADQMKAPIEGRRPKRHFWSGRRVLVTGHTGFKGGWLSLWLKALGAEVTGFALDPPSHPNFFEAVGLEEGIASLHGDLRDPKAVEKAVRQARPEVVFHLAAQPLVLAARADPSGTFATNVMGTIHLLEALRKAPEVRVGVFATTDKIYDEGQHYKAHCESDPLGGREPYGASKAACELALSAYRHCYFQNGCGLASVRAGNVIGGGDWASDRLLPDAIRAFSKGESLLLRHPAAKRPWQHVLGPLEGYLLLAEQLYQDPRTWSEAWNFGPDGADTRPVAWVVDRLANIWERGAVAPVAWQAADDDDGGERLVLSIDAQKARSRLGWRARWDLEEGLQRSVEWYSSWRNEDDMRSVSLAQIAAYESATD